MLHENRESVPFREVEPDTGFPIYAFFSHFRFWMASGCKSDWSIHYIWLQIKRLNAEIETLGANLTEVMQKENDTANQVSLCDNQTTSTRKILMIGLARDLNVGDQLWARFVLEVPNLSESASGMPFEMEDSELSMKLMKSRDISRKSPCPKQKNH